MGKGTNTLIALAILAAVIVMVALFFGLFIPNPGSLLPPLNLTSSNLLNKSLGSNSTSTIPPQFSNSSSYLYNYTLSLVNQDRATFGLSPVSLTLEPSAQQHANSMLAYSYFSHWDPYGMKPYMRYTLLGGRGAVDENVAYLASSLCTGIGIIQRCNGSLNVTQALSKMEYNMVYNDSICCNNGHRDNILDPNHNQISLGIAYNSSTIYLVEDFINNYITWQSGSPGFSNGEVTLSGLANQGYSLSSILISYDQPVTNMSSDQLNHTDAYGYGNNIAGVVGNSDEYYQGISTIVADNYQTNQNRFLVSFNMSKLITQYGAGEYTVGLWLTNSTGGNFTAATYTIFINSNGQQYQPQSV